MINKKEYDKETIIGVLELIISERSQFEKTTYTSDLVLAGTLEQAKSGFFSKKSLEKVWKEKAEKIRDTDQTQYYMFEHDGDAYITRYVGGGEWCYPSKLEKL